MSSISTSMPTRNPASLDARAAHVRVRANWMRQRLLKMIVDAGQGHPGGDLSAADIIAALYFDSLRIDPANPNAPDRDRFVMSKGHCTGALYSALAGAGFFPEAELDTYLQPLSRLNGHPNRAYLPGVETNPGPLGHGFPVAVGIAVAGQIDRADYHVFVLTGDGELQEGSMWEAAMFAAHHRLDNLVWLIDNNDLQASGATSRVLGVEPVPQKLAAFGFEAQRVDGQSVEAILAAFEHARRTTGRPFAMVCDTRLFHGIPVLQQAYAQAHYMDVPDAVWQRALDALDAQSLPDEG